MFSKGGKIKINTARTKEITPPNFLGMERKMA